MTAPFVITRLNGRLGNQLFQYAAALGLAERLGREVLADRSAIADRLYGLDAFAITAAFAGRDQVPANIRRSRLLARLGWPSSIDHRYEKRSRFENFFNTSVSPIFLDGFWQSERYFLHCTGLVRNAFRFRHPAEGRNGQFLDHIRSSNSVSIHVRRGDYVQDPAAAKRYYICPIGYFEDAFSTIQKKTNQDLTVFLFSDDPEWAQTHLKIDARTVAVTGNDGDTAHEDLRLIAHCKHHVISNSSFSWWGAWLMEQPDSITVAPPRWFIDPKMDESAIVPPRWLRQPERNIA
jgi:hypothetical protein